MQSKLAFLFRILASCFIALALLGAAPRPAFANGMGGTGGTGGRGAFGGGAFPGIGGPGYGGPGYGGPGMQMPDPNAGSNMGDPDNSGAPPPSAAEAPSSANASVSPTDPTTTITDVRDDGTKEVTQVLPSGMVQVSRYQPDGTPFDGSTGVPFQTVYFHQPNGEPTVQNFNADGTPVQRPTMLQELVNTVKGFFKEDSPDSGGPIDATFAIVRPEAQ